MCKCVSRLHTGSLHNPPDHVTSYHLLCLVYFKEHLASFFRANFETRDCFCFSVTGTRIIYDRKFLLDCRNSPLARTPPCCLPQIPGVTVPAAHPIGKLQDLKEEAEEEEKETAGKPHLRALFSALLLVLFQSDRREMLPESCVCPVDVYVCSVALWQRADGTVTSCQWLCLGGHSWDSDVETTPDRGSNMLMAILTIFIFVHLMTR